MKRIRKISILVSLFVLISILPACVGTGVNTTPATQAPSSAGAETTAKAVSNFNETGFPIVNEKITLKLMGMTNVSLLDDWSKIAFFRYMEELTNISFIFDVVPDEAFEQKKSLAFASGDLPDVFFKCNFKIAEEIKYGEQGLIIALNDLIDKYGVNLTKLMKERPEVATAAKVSSGKIYTLPYAYARENYPVYYINTKWVEDLGLSIPTNPEEYYNVLKAFKERDPNKNGKADEIPMSGVVTATSTSQITDFMQNYGLMFATNAPNFFVDNGVVRYSPIQPEYKEALIFLRKLFAEKLLDNDIFTQDTAQLKAKGENYQIGVVNCWAGFTRVGYDYDLEYSALEPFEYNGRKIWHGNPGVSRGTFAITNVNKYPEATMRWVDYLYSEEGGILANIGKEGVDWIWNPDGTWKYNKQGDETDTEFKARVSIQPGGMVPFLLPYEHNKKAEIDESGRHLNKNKDIMMQYYEEPFPDIPMTEEQVKKINTLNADIGPYVNQMLARFITGDASIENDWDEYVSTLNNMGLPALTEIIEEIYKNKP